MQNNTLEKKSGYFDYERWDVYQVALELIVVIKSVLERLPRGNAYLADQLQQQALLFPLISQKVLENPQARKRLVFIEWQNVRRPNMRVFLMCANNWS